MSDTDLLTVGATLKNRREKLGLSLEEIAERTCIRLAFLKAIEADNFEGFPGNAYLQGFLKAFAETVGLDVQEIVAQFRQQTGIRVGDSCESMPSAYDLPIMMAPRKNKPYRLIISLALFVGLIGVVYFSIRYWPFVDRSGLLDGGAVTSPAPAAVVVEPVSKLPEPAKGFAVDNGVPVPSDEAPVTENESPPAAQESASGDDASTEEVSTPAAPVEKIGVLRVEALGPVSLTVKIDDLPIRGYTLTKDTVLSWRVAKTMELHVDAPEKLQVWLDDDLLDWAGSSELKRQILELPAAPQSNQ